MAIAQTFVRVSELLLAPRCPSTDLGIKAKSLQPQILIIIQLPIIMSFNRNNEITKDGFAYSFGKFYTLPGHVERVGSGILRGMFLRKDTPEGLRK